MALKIEVGQKATPIEDGKYFTKGREYQIVAVNNGDVTLIDDEGGKHPWDDSVFMSHFKAVEQEAPNSFFTLPEPPRDYSDLGMTSEAGAAFELMCEDRDATEGTHIHAALLAQDATGMFVTGLNAVECTCKGSDEMCPCQNTPHPAPDAVARLVEAAEFFDRRRKSIEDDVSSGHSGRGPGASSWMREDDRDFFLDLRNAFDALSIALAACKGVRDAS